MKPRFFRTPALFRKWLKDNQTSATELLVGFYKKGTGKASITWPESVDQALCFGWIDGVRKSLGAESYAIRFTPRTPTSNWSVVNTRRAQALIETGLMQPAGLRAFQARDQKKTRRYSFEQAENITLDELLEETFREHAGAWKFFQAQPPGYRKVITHWIMSAKQPATRARRLDRVIEVSAARRRVDLMRPNR
ncbi:MAG TPA: YdeI/OmpD-associated family protein [Longimicrobiales bacterium]